MKLGIPFQVGCFGLLLLDEDTFAGVFLLKMSSYVG